MKLRRPSSTMLALVAIPILLLLANALTGALLARQSMAAMKEQIRARMLDISNTAADMLDGDAYEALTAEDEGSEDYRAIYDVLASFQRNVNLEFIYCIRDLGDGHFIFTVDPAEENSSEFGEEVHYTEALHTASLGTPAVDEAPYRDSYGRFYSAYSPILNSAGAVVGIVAVDFNADWFDWQVARSNMTIFASSLLSLAIGALIVLVFTGSLRRRFRTLNQELSSLSRDMDEFAREFAVPGGRDSAPQAEARSSISPSDEGMGALGEKIRAMREELNAYIGHQHAQANSMITALSSDYRSVYYINLDTDEGICYRAHSKMATGLEEGQRFSFHDVFTRYAQDYVAEPFREGFLKFIEPDSIRAGLAQEAVRAYRYLLVRDGQESYETLRVAGVRYAEDRDDHMVHAVGVGFADVDQQTRDSMAQSQALSDALAVAEEANKAKTAFLSNMSHEIRTPMNAIIGLNSIALNDPTISVKTREHLEKIGTSAQHLLTIINDILDMSRIESGRMAIKNEEFSFPRLLEQVNTVISGQCQQKGLAYDCHIDGTVRDYYIGDDGKLRQILINILGNSVKFTPAGGSVGLTIMPLACFDHKTTLSFTMRDTGIGMSAEFLPHLFDAFSQEDSSTTNRYGSTGLGMAITKSLVDMLNGKIGVESEKGKGTVFTVTLTLMDSDRNVEGEERELSVKDLSVLVVDDDPVACEHAHLALEKAGIVSETTLSGAQAVEMVRLRHARRAPYNLILVDWKMPEMDGLEVTRQIRSIVGNESAIIILTAYKWDDALEEARAAGVDSFLPKPLFASGVLDEFRQAYRRKNPQGAQQARKASLEGRRVLLAEDVTVNAEIMMMVLGMRQIQSELAENGRLAVEKFAQSPVGYYDAILMDMRMPEMDGLTATRLIRDMDRPDAKSIPIIALTANAFDEDVQRSMQAGLNAHLSKPVEPESLYATLESLIGAAPGQ